MILHPPYSHPDFADRRLMVTFIYICPRTGRVSERAAVPMSSFFGTTPQSTTPQHYWSAYDCGLQKFQDFAVLGIKDWAPLPEEPK